MKLNLITVLATILCSRSVLAAPAAAASAVAGDGDLDSWAKKESDFSIEQILKNIGPNAEGVVDGGVIASPSKSDPDYFYIWTRDSGITMKALVDKFNDDEGKNDDIQKALDDYIAFSKKIQRVDNPSGGFDDLQGLGEPKYNVNGSAFTGAWGRPQRDGPAFRSVAIMEYIQAAIKHLGKDYSSFADTYNDIIKPDLEYVTKFWKESGFDYWEEVQGNHLSTYMIQYQSMNMAADFATHFNDSTDYKSTAASIKTEMGKFYDSDKGHLIETLDNNQRSGLDAAVLIGSNEALPDGLSPFDDKIVGYLYEFVESMRKTFPINQNSNSANGSVPAGAAIGRYQEDVYDGVGTSQGNPWYLCTLAVSESLYRLASHLKSADGVTINDDNKKFYAQFGVDSDISSSDDAYKTLTDNIIKFGDEFMAIVQKYQDPAGNMSEEFNRESGEMTGAKDLTWSYGAFFTANRQRDLAKSA